MKKINLLLIAVTPIVLMACGGNEGKGGENAVPSGESVQKVDIDKQYEKAVTAMQNLDAVGFRMAGEMKTVSNTNQAIAFSGTEQNASTSVLIEISNFSAEAAIKNIQAKDVKAIDASLEASGDCTYKVEIEPTDPDDSANKNLNERVSASAYIDDGYVYADLRGLQGFVDAIYPTSASTNMKIKSQLSDIENGESEIDFEDSLESFQQYSSDVDFVKGSNGTYSYVFTIDPAKVLDQNQAGAISSSNFHVDGNSNFYLSFNESGFVSAGILLDWETSGVVNETYYSISVSTSVHVNLKVNYLYGNDVKVKEVQDKSAYVEQTLQ